ncbi:MAG: hypothetical protein HY876_02735 [Coriobacteriales bacterium]|nr:hypothetical protein [Coriobacteriales bacterium]
MPEYVIALAAAHGLPTDEIGGKAAGLAALSAAGFPVPDGVVITTRAFREVVQAAGVAESPEAFDDESLRAYCERAALSMRSMEFPFAVQDAIAVAARRLLAAGGPLAVRSSGTLEDSATASFAGVLETYTGMRSESEVLGAVRRCWGSAFQPRAARYLHEKGRAQSELSVAVVLQRQVLAERSGLIFSRDPVNRYSTGIVVEAISGVGEDLVSGEITPERYRYSMDTSSVTVTRLVGEKAPTALHEPQDVEFGLPEKRRLTDAEVALLADLGHRAEMLFGSPQDIEWAFAEGQFWVLQSRPLVFARSDEHLFPQIAEHTVLAHGVGVSPAMGSGRVMVLDADDSVPEPAADLVVVLPRLTNDLAVRLRDAAGVVADEGGATSHGANILREFEVPAVIGAAHATEELADGAVVTVDGFRGVVYEGDLALAPTQLSRVPTTRTQVFVSVLVPDRSAVVAPLADGVSSLRDDYFLLATGVHPTRLIRDGHGEELLESIARGIVRCEELFAGKPIWYKTMDAPTDEFRRLAGGHAEPVERNPLLGWRGIGRELAEPEMLDIEFGAIARAYGFGCKDVGVKLPFVRFPEEYSRAERALAQHGLTPHDDVRLGVSVEIPAVAMRLREILELGADFVSIGLSDLTMCTLALDRESRHVAEMFDPAHPAVLELLGRIAEDCREFGAFTCVCGESARDERVLPVLVDMGFDAVGVSPSYFAEVKSRIASIESR